MTKHGIFKTKQKDVENELIFDTTRDRYQLMRVGWNDLKRLYQRLSLKKCKESKVKRSLQMKIDFEAIEQWFQQ